MTAPAIAVSRTAALAAVTVVVVAALSALVALYAFTAHGRQPDLGPLFTALGAGVPGIAGALGVWVNSRRQHAETTGRLSVITAQTNGILTDRIAAGVAAALAARDAAASVVPVIVDRRLIPDQPGALTPAPLPAPLNVPTVAVDPAAIPPPALTIPATP